MPAAHDPRQNHLLAALPGDEYVRLLPKLEEIPMQLGEVLCTAGSRMRHVYFPTDSIVSLLYATEDGASTEVAVIGNEGIIGISLVMGGETMFGRAVVLNGGTAYRLNAQVLKDEFNRTGGRRKGVLHALLLRYVRMRLIQTAQTAVCNRHHSVNQQLCNWLLLSLDRLSSNELTMTHEVMASMIGVRREAITEAAGKLQRAGVIAYQRGHITVLDRAGLEAQACECYAVVSKESGRLLRDVTVQ